MNKKKLLALFMALVMTLSLMPMTVIAEELETVTPIAEPTEAVAMESVSFEAMNDVAEGSVAKVDDTGYATLAGAIEAAQDGDTVTLLANVELTEEQVINKNLCLDLNGKTISRTNDTDSTPVLHVTGGKLTVKDDSTTGTGAVQKLGTGQTAVLIDSGCELALSSGTITSSVNRTVYVNGRFTMTGGIVNGYSFVVRGSSDTSEISISGGLVNATGGSTVYNQYGGTVNISGGTITAASSNAVNNRGTGTVTVSNGTITATSSYAVYNYAGGTINITGGTFTANESTIWNNDAAGVVNISGNADISSAGNYAAKNNGGTMNISGGTLSAPQQTVYNSGVTLRISDDAVITATDGYAVNSSAALYISGGRISSPKQTVNIGTGGTLNVTGGTITATDGNYAIYSTQSIPNAVSISGGKIEAKNGHGVYGNVIAISGGTITAKDVAILISTYVDLGEDYQLDISGGTITSEENTAVEAYKVSISGGTIKGKSGVIHRNTLRVTGEPEITATGTGNYDFVFCNNAFGDSFIEDNGNFTGKIIVYMGTYIITGGKYNDNPSAYVADGYIVVDNTEEDTKANYPFKVVSDGSVAKNIEQNKTYTTLAEAITDATDGQTIKMLQNVNVTATQTIDKTLTLDLNGVIISSQATPAVYPVLKFTGSGTLTIKDSGENGEITGAKIAVTNSGSGTISVEGGTLTGSENYGLYNTSSGTVTVKDGVVTGKYGIYNLIASGVVNVTGGKVIGETNAGIFLFKSRGTANVSGGEVSTKGTAHGAIHTSSATSGQANITVSGDAVVSGGVGIWVNNSEHVVVTDRAVVSGSSYGIRASNAGTPSITISGSASVRAILYSAIFVEVQNGSVEVTGGTVTGGNATGNYAKYATGIYLKNYHINTAVSGEANISGSTYGIYVYGQSEVTVSGNAVVSGDEAGIYSYVSTNTRISVSGNSEVRGTKYGVYACGYVRAAEPAELNVTGGTVSGGTDGIFAIGCNVIVSGGQVIGTGEKSAGVTLIGNETLTRDDEGNDARVAYISKLTLDNGAVQGFYGVSLWGKGAELNVNGGTVNGTDSFAICGNGTIGDGKDYSGTVIKISGGTIESISTGLYHPQNGELNISGGTITGSTGVYVKSGKVTVTGGAFNGVGSNNEYSYNGNGANPTGDAFLFDSCGYPGGDPTATISGGEFKSTNAKAIACYAYGEGHTPLSAFITGGLYTGADKTEAPESSYIAPGYEAAQLTASNNYGEKTAAYDLWWTIGEVKANGLAAVGTPTETEAQYKAKKQVVDAQDNTVTLEDREALITVNVTANTSDAATSTAAAKAPAKLTNLKETAMESVVATAVDKAGEQSITEVDVEITLAKSDGVVGTNKITYEVHPEAVISKTVNNVTTELATVPLANDQITGSFSFKLYVGELGGDSGKVNVTHIHKDGVENLGVFDVTDSYITLTNIRQFSDFEVSPVVLASDSQETEFHFEGGSLRRRVKTINGVATDEVVSDYTDVRFTYTIKNYDANEENVSYYFQWSKDGNTWSKAIPVTNVDGQKQASLVITKVPYAWYGQTIYTRICKVAADGSITMSATNERTISQIANHFIDNSAEYESRWVDYAKFLMRSGVTAYTIVRDENDAITGYYINNNGIFKNNTDMG